MQILLNISEIQEYFIEINPHLFLLSKSQKEYKGN
jgi:hypothetical protein